jgi:hypothetical protein
MARTLGRGGRVETLMSGIHNDNYGFGDRETGCWVGRSYSSDFLAQAFCQLRAIAGTRGIPTSVIGVHGVLGTILYGKIKLVKV